MNHPCQWILGGDEQDQRSPHWWKEIRASGRISMGKCIMRKCYTNAKALHYAQWQVVAFRLPLAQHESLGWWDAPSWLSGLCPWDFMPHIDTSGTKDFQATRQEKPLALAYALQACTERLGMPTGVPSDSVRELQRCMAPLMCLSGDEIVEASLLEPEGEECRTSPSRGGGHPPG